ncbi:MAG: hypothetical protein ACKV2V_18250 [Blastocatellia bacterium]
MKISLVFYLTLVLSGAGAAQTPEKPVRAVTDPGVITTRQAITPAGVQTVFDGRVYGVTFGEKTRDIFALTARGHSSYTWTGRTIAFCGAFRCGKVPGCRDCALTRSADNRC